MGEFAAAETQRHLDLVAFLEEAVHGLGLDLIVVDVDVRPELDLLDLHDLLPLARLGLLLLLLELVFAIVEDLADGGVGVGRHLHQIQSRFLGGLHGGRRGHDALLFAVLIDEQYPRHADVFVDARTVLGRRRRHGTANRQALLGLWTRAGTRRRARPRHPYMTKRKGAIKTTRAQMAAAGAR